MSSAAESHGDHGHGVGHIVPLKLLFGVLVVLLILTVVTVWSAQFDLGPFNIILALFIAGFKGALVVLYFMHLRWSQPINSVVFLVSMGFFILFVVFALLDTSVNQAVIDQIQAPATNR